MGKSKSKKIAEKHPEKVTPNVNIDIDSRFAELEKKAAAMEKLANQLRNENGAKSIEIKELTEMLASREKWIKRLQTESGQKDMRIKEMRETIASRDKWIQRLKNENLEIKETRRRWIDKLHDDLARKNTELLQIKEKKVDDIPTKA